MKPAEFGSVTMSWGVIFLLVATMEGLLYFLDPLPMFFMGDSASYIKTALTGWIPPDRSFLYGYIVRWVSLPTRSLSSLVGLQVAIGVATTFLAAYLLVRYFGISRRWALLVGALYAAEPMHLMYERYIMTETLSLGMFAFGMTVAFRYIGRPRFSTMFLFHLLGIATVALRLIFLPAVLSMGILLPILAIPAFRNSVQAGKRMPKTERKRWAGMLSPRWMAGISLAFSMAMFLILHGGYKTLNGALSGRPPAYQYENGFFLLADWGPVLRRVDLPFPEKADAVFDGLRYDLSDRNTRGSQRWGPGGLISNLRAAIPNSAEANRIASQTAMNALRRDPFGVAALGALTFADYWDIGTLRAGILVDRGDGRELPEDFLYALKIVYGLEARLLPHTETLTKWYYLHAWPWYLFLLCLPVPAFFAVCVCDHRNRPFLVLLLTVTCATVIMACLLVERPTVRYLQPLGWMAFLVIPPLVENCMGRIRRGSGSMRTMPAGGKGSPTL